MHVEKRATLSRICTLAHAYVRSLTQRHHMGAPLTHMYVHACLSVLFLSACPVSVGPILSCLVLAVLSCLVLSSVRPSVCLSVGYMYICIGMFYPPPHTHTHRSLF